MNRKPTIYTPISTTVDRMDIEEDRSSLRDNRLFKYEETRWAMNRVTVKITRLWK